MKNKMKNRGHFYLLKFANKILTRLSVVLVCFDCGGYSHWEIWRLNTWKHHGLRLSDIIK